MECLDGSIVMESRHRFKLEVQLLGNFFKCVNNESKQPDKSTNHKQTFSYLLGIDSQGQVFCEKQDSLKTFQEGDPIDLGVRVQEIATSPILCTNITVMREREREKERERDRKREIERSPLNK